MKILIATLLLAPAFAFGKAEPVSLNFNAVPIVQFGQAMFKGMMRRDFVVAPDVVNLDRKITIDVKSISSDDLPRFVEDLLAREGIRTTLRDGVYYLTLRRMDGLSNQEDVVMGQPQPAHSIETAQGRTGGIGGREAPDAMSVQLRKDDDESELFEPQNRTSEFVAAVIVGGFGRQAAVVSGQHVVLTGSKTTVAKMLILCKALDTVAKTIDVSASWIEVASNAASGRGISLAATVIPPANDRV